MTGYPFRTVVYLILDASVLIACLVHIPSVVHRPSAPFEVVKNQSAVVIGRILD